MMLGCIVLHWLGYIVLSEVVLEKNHDAAPNIVEICLSPSVCLTPLGLGFIPFFKKNRENMNIVTKIWELQIWLE
jgi:hypothetical protein